jgi:hypothetical protein
VAAFFLGLPRKGNQNAARFGFRSLRCAQTPQNQNRISGFGKAKAEGFRPRKGLQRKYRRLYRR